MASIVDATEVLVDRDRITNLNPHDTVRILRVHDTVASSREVLLAVLATHEKNPGEHIAGSVVDLLNTSTPDEGLNRGNGRGSGQVGQLDQTLLSTYSNH